MTDDDLPICYYDIYRCQDLYECYKLISSLIRDIIILEEEMVKWRYALVPHLDPLTARDLQCDIFDCLSENHDGEKAFEAYLKYFGIENPIQSKEHVRKLWRLAHGEDEDSVFL